MAKVKPATTSAARWAKRLELSALTGKRANLDAQPTGS
jgi:hypothetical protein